MAVVERREERAARARRAEEDGARAASRRAAFATDVDADRLRVRVRWPQVVAELDRQRASRRAIAKRRAAAKPARRSARVAKTPARTSTRNAGRRRDHVAVEEERRVARSRARPRRTRSVRRPSARRRRATRQRRATSSATTPTSASDGEVVDVVPPGRHEVERVLPHRPAGERAPAAPRRCRRRSGRRARAACARSTART